MSVVKIYVHVENMVLKCVVECDEYRGKSCGNSVDIIEEDYVEDMFEKKPV